MQFLSQVDELRVPVRRTHVELHTERDRREAVIFLAPEVTAREFFEEDAPFFPAEEGGKIRLYARSAVAALVVDAGDTAPESLAALGVHYEARTIAVHLRSGRVVIGLLTSLYGRARTLDLLNQPLKTFAVHAEGRVHHIAKAHVERIEEL